MTKFDESKHPRVPAGSAKGGEWTGVGSAYAAFRQNSGVDPFFGKRGPSDKTFFEKGKAKAQPPRFTASKGEALSDSPAGKVAVTAAKKGLDLVKRFPHATVGAATGIAYGAAVGGPAGLVLGGLAGYYGYRASSLLGLGYSAAKQARTLRARRKAVTS